MAADVSKWTIEFAGCAQESPECDAGLFSVSGAGKGPLEVEVRVTSQIESILARELGKKALTEGEREKIVSVAGRRLIEECLAKEGRVDPVVLLTSQIFRLPGAEKRLLQECGLL
jgi:hypothetical protein